MHWWQSPCTTTVYVLTTDRVLVLATDRMSILVLKQTLHGMTTPYRAGDTAGGKQSFQAVSGLAVCIHQHKVYRRVV